MSSTEFADEVVTRAVAGYVDLEGLGTLAVVTLDNGQDPSRPNTFGPGGLASLDAALDEVFGRSDVRALAVTGKPAGGFAVGADLSGVPRITSRDQALQLGRLGHRVFRRLTESPIPTFAFINGAALGGGLELALACHYRTVSSGTAAIALPECFLGLVPGWGGTQLLPNLIGPGAALGVIVDNALNQNRMLTAAQAHDLGIVDVVLPAEDFVAASTTWAAGVLAGSTSVARADVARDESWDEAVARTRAAVDARLHGAAPAPYRALELVQLAKTAALDEGFAAEDEALADLVVSPELQAGLYAFDLVQRRAKRPAGVPQVSPRPVRKVGVVGAGLMASQLGLLFAQRLNVPVVLTDVDQARVDKGVAWVHEQIAGQLQRGRLTADAAGTLTAHVTGSLSKDAFADADLVIEAVFEDLAVKQQVFAECEAVVRDTCILATNTSSLSVSAMAGKLSHPERVVGLHFFNPVAVLPLLEVVRADTTDDETLATAFAVAAALRKSPVLVQDAPAFVVNRLLTRFLGEVFLAVDEGTPVEVADQALEPLGLPMAPLDLLAMVGPAVALHVAKTLHAAYPDRFRVSPNLQRLVDAGKPGVWTWGPDGKVLDPEVAALLEVSTAPSTAEEVRGRALQAMAEEIRIMLDERVVADLADIDLCMLLGAGWPFHLGGITPYLRRRGLL